ncbi:HIT family protein [Lacticaseibacillus paracasei]|uniref:HIT family protein n=1 Tax=Lacticaseibacillus paracasei TaxID=1597 RepID=UPI001951D614|nr:HIT family protein [Lacticaseibacillus paracasei]MBM6413356.1 HIT family protein [Lacticaseibacillus paracasei]
MPQADCIFCHLPQTSIVLENDLAVAFWDIHPVSQGHLLVIPRTHRRDFFDLSEEELLAINRLIQAGKTLIDQQYHPDGYNVGANVGLYGGQTVMHCHLHLIPRYRGDDPNPAGGIRKMLSNGQEFA